VGCEPALDGKAPHCVAVFSAAALAALHRKSGKGALPITRRNVPCDSQKDYAAAPTHNFCVVSRARDEDVNLREFAAHYLEEGATRIVILDDGSSPPIPTEYGGPQVEVYRILGGASEQSFAINVAVNELAGVRLSTITTTSQRSSCHALPSTSAIPPLMLHCDRRCGTAIITKRDECTTECAYVSA
jgi:hypothetical protein